MFVYELSGCGFESRYSLKAAESWKPLTIFAKDSILDVWQGSDFILLRFSEHVFPDTCIS